MILCWHLGVGCVLGTKWIEDAIDKSKKGGYILAIVVSTHAMFNVVF